MLPPGASADEVFAESQAVQRLKPQYHCNLPGEGVLDAKPGAKPIAAISQRSWSAVSHTKSTGNPVLIADLIPTQMCRSIASQIAIENSVEPMSYLRPEVRSERHWRGKAAQYHPRRARYQASPIDAAVAESGQPAGPGRRDTALMVKIGLLLGLAYVAFLALWIWATRVRPRLTRPRRGI